MVVTASEVPEEFIVPDTIASATLVQQDIGRILNEIVAEETKLAAAKRALEDEAEKKLAPLREKAVGWAKALNQYAETNRVQLTRGNTLKTVSFPNAGNVSWRQKPDRVTLTLSEDAVFSALRKRKQLLAFTREVRVINKDALLADKALASKIPGIEIKGGEKFFVRPSGAKAHVESDDDEWSVVIDKDKKQVE